MDNEKYIKASVLDRMVCDSMAMNTHADPVLKLMHNHDCNLFRDMIAAAPAANVPMEVHAMWVSSQADWYEWHCTSCSGGSMEITNFCPHCGARMDGESYD